MGMTIFEAEEYIRYVRQGISELLSRIGDGDIPQNQIRSCTQMALTVCVLTKELLAKEPHAGQINLSREEMLNAVSRMAENDHIKNEIFHPSFLKTILADIAGGNEKRSKQINRINTLIAEADSKQNDPERYDAEKLFAELVQVNEAVRFADPEKALSIDRLHSVFTDPSDIEKHKKAQEQKDRIAQTREKLFKDPVYVHDFWVPSWIANFTFDSNDEYVKLEKSRLLLGRNTHEAHNFQMEFVREMINKMLALPDEKLNLSTYDEAGDFYSENIQALDMLRNLESLMGGPGLNAGIRDRIDIPQNIIDTLKHKRDLASENIFNVEKELLYLASDDYAVKQYTKTFSDEDLQTMLKAPGSYKLPESVRKSIEEDLALKKTSLPKKKIAPDPAKNGAYLKREDVNLSATCPGEYATLENMLIGINDTVSLDALKKDQIFQAFYKDLRSARYNEEELLPTDDGEKFYNGLKAKAAEYINAELAAAGGKKKDKKLDPEVKNAVDFAGTIVEYCDKAIAHRAMNNKVSSMQMEQKDDFEEMMDIMQAVSTLAQRAKNLKKDESIQKELNTLSDSFDDVMNLFSVSCKYYGQYGVLQPRERLVKEIGNMISVCKKAPADLLKGQFDINSSFYQTYNRMREFAANFELSDDAIKKMIKDHIPKTLQRNMDLIKNRMSVLCGHSEITEETLSQISEFLIKNPQVKQEDALSLAVEDVVYKNRSAADEIRYCTAELRRLQDADLQEANAYLQRTNVMKRIATLELLKNKKDYKITGIQQLEKDALEFIKDKPNFFLNVCCNKNAVREYLADPDKIANNFEYNIGEPDYNYDYEQAKINIRQDMEANGVEPPAIEDLNPAPMDDLKKKAILQNEKMSQLPGSMFDLYGSLYGINYNKPKWSRIIKYIVKTPQNTADAKEALNFIKKFSENKKDEEGKTFSYRVLEGILGKLKNFDYAKLAAATEKDFINDYELFQKDWYFAFAAQSDVAPLCEAEGYKLSEEEKLLLALREDQTRASYTHKLMKVRAIANPFSEMITNNKNIGTDFEDDFYNTVMGNDFYRVLTNYYNAQKSRIRYDEGRDIALARSGLLDIPDLHTYTLRTYDENGNVTVCEMKNFFSNALQSGIFSLEKPGEAAMFYGYNKDFKEIVSSSTYDDLKLAIESFNTELNIDPAKKHTGAEYESAFNAAYGKLLEKITYEYAPHVSTEDLARAFVMQRMQDSIKLAKTEDNFDDLAESIVNEELIRFRTKEMTESPEFKSFIESIGGSDPQTSCLNYPISAHEVNSGVVFERFGRMLSDSGKEMLSWTEQLSANEPEKIRRLKEQLTNELDLNNSKSGYQMEKGKKLAQIMLKLALIKKNTEEGKSFTLRELEDQARYYLYSPEGSKDINRIIPIQFASEYAMRILSPKKGEANVIDCIINGLKLTEEKRADNYESPEEYFIKKYELPDQPTEEEQRNFNERKEEFLELCRFNEIAAYSNNKLRRSYDDIWNLQLSEELEKQHEQNLEWNKQLKAASRPELRKLLTKPYIKRAYKHNFDSNLSELEKIKLEKAKVLLEDDSEEGLEFQKEYVCEIINRMLMIPDDMLAISGTPEASQYAADHWPSIYLLYEKDYIIGNHGYDDKACIDFDIPKDIIDAARHKADVAQTGIWGMQNDIEYKADKHYKGLELFKDASCEDINMALKVAKEYGIGFEAGRTLTKLQSVLADKENVRVKEKVNRSTDGKYLDPNKVKIRMKANNVSLSDMFTRLYKEVLNADVTKDDSHERFTSDMGGLKSVAEANAGAENSPEFIWYYKMLNDRINAYLNENLPKGKNLKDLPQADQTAIKCLRDFAAFSNKKVSYLTAKEKYTAMEKALGIKENILDDVINAARLVQDKSAAMDFALSPKEAETLNKIRNAARYLSSTVKYYDSRFGRNNISLENAGALIGDLQNIRTAAAAFPAQYAAFSKRPDLKLAIDKLVNIAKALPETEAEIKDKIEERSVKTLYSNMKNFRYELKSQGYNKDISDEELLGRIKTGLRNGFENGNSKIRISQILKEIAYEGRTIKEELAFSRELLMRFDGKELEEKDYKSISRIAAFVEAFKDKKNDDPLPTEEDINKEILSYFNAHPNALANLTSLDPERFKRYLEDPKSLDQEFVWEEKKFVKPDFQANYTAALTALLGDGIDVRGKSRKYIEVNFDEHKKKAIREMADEEALNSQELLSKTANALGMKIPTGWERLSTYFLKAPNSAENIKYNSEFCKNLCTDQGVGGMSFRKEQLLKKLDEINALKPEDVLDLSREDLIDNWPKIRNSWGLLFVMKRDGAEAMKDAGIELSKQQQQKIDVLYTHAVSLYTQLQAKMELYGSPNEYVLRQLNLTDKEFIKSNQIDSFEKGFMRKGHIGTAAEKTYQDYSLRYNAMKKAGVLDLPNQSGIKLLAPDGKGKTKPFDDFVGMLYTENGPFRIIGADQKEKYYAFDKTGSVLFCADPTENLAGKTRDFNIEIKPKPGQQYDKQGCLNILKQAQTNLNQQMYVRGDLTRTEDLARRIAIDRLIENLSDPKFSEQYEGFYKDLVNEEYINANTKVIAASEPFKRMLDSEQIGGAEYGFLKKGLGIQVSGSKLLKLFNEAVDAEKKEHRPKPQMRNQQPQMQVQNQKAGPQEEKQENKDSRLVPQGDDKLIP